MTASLSSSSWAATWPASAAMASPAAVMDDHRPPLHQRCRHQFGITAVTQQEGQIGVVPVGFGDRQAGLVDGDRQEPVDLIQHDRAPRRPTVPPFP